MILFSRSVYCISDYGSPAHIMTLVKVSNMRRLPFPATPAFQYSAKLIEGKWKRAQRWQKYNHQISSIYGERVTAL